MAPSRSGGTTTVIFTDIEGHTPMMRRLGDARGRDVLRVHERITRDTLRRHGGSEVKTMGDGFLASFSSTERALRCAIDLQRAFSDYNETAEEPIKIRIGINAGEPAMQAVMSFPSWNTAWAASTASPSSRER